MAFTVSGLLASLPGPATERPESVVDGHTAVLRPLTSADALAALDAVDPAAELVARCLLCLTGPDGARLDAVPDALVGPLAAALAGSDPAALIEVGLSCAECGHGWGEPLDVGGFLWREVDAWARRTLREVHALAGAYGWREADILALTPARRAAYLQLVGE
ncbi:hypothetical protein G7085_06995 [Tessaracoccus sp. HDW20]|uniref:hypothetical protein n=1 Tax=Tessaracoccus coleopterorum TaxID=2714950 RepID=UPI0018D42175|nr:hypothetical protein [Tessaracoccus coleopterorum]NHB84438.1 hypothetical protein [Tessaracoccus coleopterorum]